ncbi:helix-turn-helix domain-containing protein [Streptomyces sp. NPDC056600]|uniref:helix-turn-helix domain-containing protein n=1 Tax=Streptomyces sp. NPDC056600 TaxID=3345874 RepID=UPI0036975A14
MEQHEPPPDLPNQAVALRRRGLSTRQIREELGINNWDLRPLLAGEPPPEWTKRPRAKDDLRARARELRAQGWTYNQIKAELGCSKSSVSLWVRDLPRPERTRTREEASEIGRRGWEPRLRAREEERRRTKQEARESIGALSDRELFLIGVALYWAEGAKDKPYARRESVLFVNSDPGVMHVFLAWLRLLGVEQERLRFHVMIHETADVRAAEEYWADQVGVDRGLFGKTTLKKHNPRTVRLNTGSSYRGCLVLYVRQGAELYRRIEGAWSGIVQQARSTLR